MMELTVNELIFIDSFSTRAVTNCGYCACGKTYYNDLWLREIDDDEIAKLEKSEQAELTEYLIRYIEFNGSEYVDVCVCWREKAKNIMDFIHSHTNKIAKYVNAQKNAFDDS